MDADQRSKHLEGVLGFAERVLDLPRKSFKAIERLPSWFVKMLDEVQSWVIRNKKMLLRGTRKESRDEKESDLLKGIRLFMPVVC